MWQGKVKFYWKYSTFNLCYGIVLLHGLYFSLDVLFSVQFQHQGFVSNMEHLQISPATMANICNFIWEETGTQGVNRKKEIYVTFVRVYTNVLSIAHVDLLLICNFTVCVSIDYLIYHGIYKSNTTSATCGAETIYHSGEPEFNPDFSGVRVARSLVFCIMLCRSLFVLFHLATALSVLRFTTSDYSSGIFKLFLSFLNFLSTYNNI